MYSDDEEFYRDLMETFRQEGEEQIRVLSKAVVDLETADGVEATGALVEVLFRQAHSLKGASAAVEHPLTASVCQSLESALASLKNGSLALSPVVIDTLSECVDCLHGCLLTTEEAEGERASLVIAKLSALADPAQQKASTMPAEVERPRPSPGNGEGPVPQEPAPRAVQAEEMRAGTDTVRVPTSKLESLMLQAEEFISHKIATGQRSTALRDVSSRMESWKRVWYQARVSGDRGKLDEFLEWNSAFMEGLTADVRMLSKSADDERRAMGPMVDELVDGMKRVLMLPVSSLLSAFPKMVRDLARTRGKQVELLISGADIEIDKRIIENLKDPLTHILRNGVDHGIETPEVRQGLGKPARGHIRIAVSRLENNRIQICVSDDGAGIDVQRLREVAVREGLRTQSQLEATEDAEALRLAFASGLSTSQVVSQVSGRGLGLAIVEEKVENLGGSVTLETAAGKGANFRIIVPATLATARGILAQISDWPFVMPVVGVDRVVRVRKTDIRTIENQDTIQLEGHTLPLVYMHEVLDLPLKPQRNVSNHLTIIVAGSGDDRVAFAVDRILDEQEVLVKTLGPQLTRVRNVAGGTIIGSGKVVPIMNISDLIQSASGGATRGSRATAAAANGDGGRKSVLIVEDSITSRMLLKNVLEAAGYYVRPSVDGMDALSALHEEDFDLVISDIEMPRMDGFELTTKIRSDSRLARMPVMLVTGLESQEDKARGVRVGANAYIAKSSFTQGTLLETARSLL